MEPNTQQSSQIPQTDGSEINPMVVLSPGERVICQIKRHPIGMISQFVVAGLLIVVGAIAALFMSTHASNTYNEQHLKAFIYGGLALLVIGTLLFLGVANSVYWKNQWVVTSDSITQILQVSLMAKQVSQLSLDDLEDVTVVQTGLLQTMLNYGTLRAETAGERSKFMFLYCPDPSHYARQILEAREEFRNYKRYNEGAQREPAYYGNTTRPQDPTNPENPNDDQQTPIA